MNQNDLPLVSVIIPCYNHEKYVTEAIESVINQSYQNIELIVIDDGSKDNSIKVIQKLADKYRFVFIHRKNKGLSATLNEGIKISKGTYFCVLASDDIYILDKIEKQVLFMEHNKEYGMCYGNMIQLDNKKIVNKTKVKNAKNGFVFDELLMFNFVIPALTVMIKKDIFNSIGFFDEKSFIEDYDMWLRISDKYKIGYLNQYLGYYRIHETNISKQTLNMYKAQKIIIQKWSEYKNYHKALKKWKMIWFNVLSLNHKKEAKKYLIHTLLNMYNPRALNALFKYIFR